MCGYSREILYGVKVLCIAKGSHSDRSCEALRLLIKDVYVSSPKKETVCRKWPSQSLCIGSVSV